MVNLSHQQTGDEETMEYVRNLKETGIELLCRFGRFGVGKSIIAGMFRLGVAITRLRKYLPYVK